MLTQIQSSFSWLSPKERILGCILEPNTNSFMTSRCILDAKYWGGLISLRFKFHYKQLPFLWLTQNIFPYRWFLRRIFFCLEAVKLTRLERTLLSRCILLFWSCLKNHSKILFLKVSRSIWLQFFHHYIRSNMNGCCSRIKKMPGGFFQKSAKHKKKITWWEVV